jgi:hypothetical protein
MKTIKKAALRTSFVDLKILFISPFLSNLFQTYSRQATSARNGPVTWGKDKTFASEKDMGKFKGV